MGQIQKSYNETWVPSYRLYHIWNIVGVMHVSLYIIRSLFV